MVPIYGRVEGSVDRAGEYNPTWTNWSLLIGRPHDILVAGFEGRTVNYLPSPFPGEENSVITI